MHLVLTSWPDGLQGCAGTRLSRAHSLLCWLPENTVFHILANDYGRRGHSLQAVVTYSTDRFTLHGRCIPGSWVSLSSLNIIFFWSHICWDWLTNSAVFQYHCLKLIAVAFQLLIPWYCLFLLYVAYNCRSLAFGSCCITVGPMFTIL